MHVDGSVISNVPAVPEALLLAKLPRRTTARPRLYIIVNGKLAPDFDLVADGTLSIVARSFFTTVKANTTLIATYEFAQRNAWEFRATAIEHEHVIATSSFNFDTAYLRTCSPTATRVAAPAGLGRPRCPDEHPQVRRSALLLRSQEAERRPVEFRIAGAMPVGKPPRTFQHL
jgi:hypothetical protein